MKKTLLGLSLSLLLLYGTVAKIQAATLEADALSIGDDSITLTAMPPRLGDDSSLKAKPGEKLQTAIKVRNNSNKAFTINTAVDDFIIGEDGEMPVAVTEDVDYRWSLKNWLILAPEFQVLQPRQTGVINIIVDVPKDALPGGHYAMVTHKPVGLNGEKFSESAASKISQRVGTLLYIMVDGPINEQAFIRDFKAPKFTEYGPVSFDFTIDNQSDIHIKPILSIEIYNLLGVKVGTIPIESKNVFPMVSRNFTATWDAVWGSGFYRAKLVMSYGESGNISVANTSFWLLPFTLVIAGLIVLIALLAVFVAVRRHLIHSGNKEKNRMELLEKKIAELETERLQKFD